MTTTWQPGQVLEPVEAKMVEAAGIGEQSEPVADATDAASVTIRAAVLRYLLVGGEWKVAAQGVRLRDLRITGRLDLEGAQIAWPLRLQGCYLDGADPVNLDYANVSAVSLIGCKLPGLSGKTLKVDKDLDLTGSTLSGPLRLQVATITGDLNCTGTRLQGVGDALSAATMTVNGNVFLTEAVTTDGGVDLETADIDGTLTCSGAELNGAVARYGGSYALFAQWIKVGGPVKLNVNFVAAHTVFLLGADIGGNLNCRSAKLRGTGRALDGEQMKVGGNVLLERARTTVSRINLLSAEIAGNLKCTDAFLNPKACAVYGERLKLHGDVFFGTTERSPDADRPVPPPDGELEDGRRPYGWIWLSDAEIEGNLNFENAVLNGAASFDGVEFALYGERMNVQGDLLFDGVDCPNGAIGLRSANIKGNLLWAPGEHLHTQVNLADATVDRLQDDWRQANACWPTEGLLNLQGFTYSSFSGDHPASVEQRLAWIRSQWPQYRPKGFWAELLSFLRHPGRVDSAGRFATQPYEQLATVYQQDGQDDEARKVVIERRRDRRRYGNLTGYHKALNLLLDKTIQYGYQTWRAVVMLLALYVVAVAVFVVAQHHGNLIVPLAATAGGEHAPPVTQCTSSYPCFYPAGYAIDTVIPIINVHQATYWGPNGHASWGHLLTVFTWLCTALGWALATLTVAGYTGLVRNADSL